MCRKHFIPTHRPWTLGCFHGFFIMDILVFVFLGYLWMVKNSAGDICVQTHVFKYNIPVTVEGQSCLSWFFRKNDMLLNKTTVIFWVLIKGGVNSNGNNWSHLAWSHSHYGGVSVSYVRSILSNICSVSVPPWGLNLYFKHIMLVCNALWLHLPSRPLHLHPVSINPCLLFS